MGWSLISEFLDDISVMWSGALITTSERRSDQIPWAYLWSSIVCSSFLHRIQTQLLRTLRSAATNAVKYSQFVITVSKFSTRTVPQQVTWLDQWSNQLETLSKGTDTEQMLSAISCSVDTEHTEQDGSPLYIDQTMNPYGSLCSTSVKPTTNTFVIPRKVFRLRYICIVLLYSFQIVPSILS
jgi:hypothetical protein